MFLQCGKREEVYPLISLIGSLNIKMADVWSCGVILYVMLVGEYPFEDPQDPNNSKETRKAAQYDIPQDVHISEDCRCLLSRIFVASPSRRVTIKEIKSHPWFLKNLPRELTKAAQAIEYRKGNPGDCLQSDEEIMKIVEEARVPPPASILLPEQFQALVGQEKKTTTETRKKKTWRKMTKTSMRRE